MLLEECCVVSEISLTLLLLLLLRDDLLEGLLPIVSSIGRSGTSKGVSARQSSFDSEFKLTECVVIAFEAGLFASDGEETFVWIFDGERQFPPSTLVDKGVGDRLLLSL